MLVVHCMLMALHTPLAPRMQRCDRASTMVAPAPAAFKSEAAEEAYWRAYFWDAAAEKIEQEFGAAGKRELKRIREYLNVNRAADPSAGMPKKLRKHPHYEVIGGYFPGLTTNPFHDASSAPFAELKRAGPAIRRELDALLVREHQFEDVGKPLGWRTMPIYYKGVLQPSFPADECPETMRALSKLRLAGETVAFQRQSPGTGLPRHVDPCSWVLACHLGMVCPDEGPEMAYICVAGQKHYWQDGEVMVFDPSFLHETFNPTSQDRIILNIDIFHPELTDLECNVIRETIRLKKQMFGSTPEEVHPDRAPGR